MKFLEWFLMRHRDCPILYVARTPEEMSDMEKWREEKKRDWLSPLYVIGFPPEQYICGVRGHGVFINDITRFPEDFVRQIIWPFLTCRPPNFSSEPLEKWVKEQYNLYDFKSFVYDIHTNTFLL